ncbi:MAG: phage capsid protein, partial [Gammaproteobacteria bacterium]
SATRTKLQKKLAEAGTKLTAQQANQIAKELLIQEQKIFIQTERELWNRLPMDTLFPTASIHTGFENILRSIRPESGKNLLDLTDSSTGRGGAKALGRKCDDQILTTLDSTSSSTVTIAVGSSAAVRNGLLGMLEAMISADAYEPGNMYGVMSPKLWAMASTINEFASSDYVGADGQVYNTGAPVGSFKRWAQVLWTVHSGNPGVGTATSKVFLWNKSAVGYASGKAPGNLAGTMSGETSVGADITWHGDRAAHFVNHAMSGNSVMIDDGGVIEGNVDDTAVIPTS